MPRSILIAALLIVTPALAKIPRPKPVPKAPQSVPKPPADDVAFAEAEAALKRFEALRMPAAKGLTMAAWSSQLQKSMSEMAKGMADLQQRYARLAQTAAPRYAIPALVRVGEVMEKFAAEVEHMPIHPDLPVESADVMRDSLRTGADSMRVAARGSYVQAVQRAEATGFTGEWLDFARAALLRLPEAVKPVLRAPGK